MICLLASSRIAMEFEGCKIPSASRKNKIGSQMGTDGKQIRLGQRGV
jgi:hypothetical protein